eukprot:TRINITY_DN25499_c0_g1_i1.p1 TRINITY_DN25499_c0_g1~~TRINITY_DN25499_c0_g1_i1.p1  ORF type:complete len:374 (-),score=82.52 TRINITY_DN25499_c0_g1_i1:84-1205(-)
MHDGQKGFTPLKDGQPIRVQSIDTTPGSDATTGLELSPGYTGGYSPAFGALLEVGGSCRSSDALSPCHIVGGLASVPDPSSASTSTTRHGDASAQHRPLDMQIKHDSQIPGKLIHPHMALAKSLDCELKLAKKADKFKEKMLEWEIGSKAYVMVMSWRETKPCLLHIAEAGVAAPALVVIFIEHPGAVKMKVSRWLGHESQGSITKVAHVVDSIDEVEAIVGAAVRPAAESEVRKLPKGRSRGQCKANDTPTTPVDHAEGITLHELALREAQRTSLEAHQARMQLVEANLRHMQMQRLAQQRQAGLPQWTRLPAPAPGLEAPYPLWQFPPMQQQPEAGTRYSGPDPRAGLSSLLPETASRSGSAEQWPWHFQW